MMMTVTVCIQAGGQSRRMGRNKALIPFHGLPLIQRVVERVRSVASEILILSSDRAAFEFLDLPVLPDLIEGRGVLGGLYTALFASKSAFVVSLACDMPFVNPALLQAELELISAGGGDVVIPESPNGLEPLHAVYRRDTCLPLVREALSQEQRRLVAWFERANVRVMTQAEVAEFDPGQTAFFNINTPEDLARAEQLA
jgi:molybdopterin-guanine dinucleotide biosynthesis protein A